MTCSEVLMLLSTCADGEEEISPELAAHLAQCPECAGALTFYRELNDRLGQLESPPDGFREALMERLGEQPPVGKARRFSFGGFTAMAAAAAALIFAIWAGKLQLPSLRSGEYSDSEAAAIEMADLAKPTADDTAAPAPSEPAEDVGASETDRSFFAAGDGAAVSEEAGSPEQVDTPAISVDSANVSATASSVADGSGVDYGSRRVLCAMAAAPGPAGTASADEEEAGSAVSDDEAPVENAAAEEASATEENSSGTISSGALRITVLCSEDSIPPVLDNLGTNWEFFDNGIRQCSISTTEAEALLLELDDGSCDIVVESILDPGARESILILQVEQGEAPNT